VTDAHPIVTPNAINFTPDNKRAYAYTGAMTIDSGATDTVLEGNTNSEYLVAEFQAGRNDKTSAEIVHTIYLNSLLVWYSKMDNGKNPNQAPSSTPLLMIIPPFTHIEWKVASMDDATSNFTGLFTAKTFGMTETGYQ